MALKERQLLVDKPRLRKKRPRADEPGEVEIPAYTALQADQPLADRMLELVLQGVSTRKYETVLPALADQVGSEQVGGLAGDHRGGDAGSEGVGRTGAGRAGTCWWSTSTGSCSGTTTCWRRWGWDADGRKHVLGLCGGGIGEHGGHRRPGSKIWWHGACGLTAGVCS